MVSVITLTPVTQQYVDFQRSVFTHPSLPLMYSLIVLMPCERLWPWIANQMISKMNPSFCYYSWVYYNKDAIGLVENLINSLYLKSSCNDEFCIEKAQELYSTAIAFERDFFASTTNSKLVSDIVIPSWLNSTTIDTDSVVEH